MKISPALPAFAKTGTPGKTRRSGASRSPAETRLASGVGLGASWRAELALLAILAGLGVAIRISFLSRAAVDHFDEGIYASKAWFDDEFSYQYPRTHLYAPPLVPNLAKAVLILEHIWLSGSAQEPLSWTVLLPSLVAGCLMPLAVWWVVRGWFGGGAAIGAAALASFSDLHALYSRAILTDVLLTLLLLLAIGFARSAIEGPARWAMVAAAGVFTGLAWWTKYNGWLPLAIVWGGLTLHAIWRRCGWDGWRRATWRWALIAGIAVLVWLPVLIWVERLGGYGQVAANHRQYLVGIGGWLDAASRQHANIRFFDGATTLVGMLAAAVCAFLIRWNRVAPRDQMASIGAAVGVGLACAASAAVVGSDMAMAALCVLGLVSYWRKRGDRDSSSDLPLCVLSVWFFGMLALTPMYHAYPRLALPWLTAAWIGAGLGLDACAAALCRSEVGKFPNGLPLAAALISLVTLAVCSPHIGSVGAPAWTDRTEIRQVAAKIREDLREMAARRRIPEDGLLLCVFGEPALFHQLLSQGVQHVLPVSEVPRQEQTCNDPTVRSLLLVVGPHARATGEFRRRWSHEMTHYSELRRYPYRPSDLVLLDDHDPRSEGTLRGKVEEAMVLYVMK